MCLSWFWSSTRMLRIWFNIGWFFLLYSMNCIAFWEFVYTTHLLSSVLFNNNAGCCARWLYSIYLSDLSYIFIVVFLSVLLLVWLPFRFLHNFGSLSLGILYTWCCCSIYTRISILVHSFLDLRIDLMLLRTVILSLIF